MLRVREGVDEAAELLERRGAELAAATERAEVAEDRAAQLSAVAGSPQVVMSAA